jgi:transcriptional regulator with XRE-family HTH domain
MPGHVIKKYREMRNYSQKFVAAKMGMSQNAYSKIENNITQLTVHHVKELSKILEVPITDLLKDEFEIHKPFAIPRTVTKADLLEHIHILQKTVADKQATKHDAYIVALSLIVAAENSLSSVH